MVRVLARGPKAPRQGQPELQVPQLQQGHMQEATN